MNKRKKEYYVTRIKKERQKGHVHGIREKRKNQCFMNKRKINPM